MYICLDVDMSKCLDVYMHICIVICVRTCPHMVMLMRILRHTCEGSSEIRGSARSQKV